MTKAMIFQTERRDLIEIQETIDRASSALDEAIRVERVKLLAVSGTRIGVSDGVTTQYQLDRAVWDHKDAQRETQRLQVRLDNLLEVQSRMRHKITHCNRCDRAFDIEIKGDNAIRAKCPCLSLVSDNSIWAYNAGLPGHGKRR